MASFRCWACRLLVLVGLLAHVDAVRPPSHTAKAPSRSSFSRRSALITTAAVVALGPATAAHAAYGAAQGAVSSLPQTAFDKMSAQGQLEELEALNVQKRAQQVSVLSEKQVDVLLDQLRAQQVSISKTIEADVTANIEFDKKIRQFRDRLSQAKADLVEVNRRKTELERKAESERKAVEDRKREAERTNGEMETPTPPVPTVMPGLLRQLSGEAEALSELVRKLEAEVNEMETLELQAGRLREQEIRGLREKLSQQGRVRDSLLKRNTLLEALDAQPEWFNYAAAFLASCASTCVMHPVDTIKTRMVTKAAKPSVETEGDRPALALAPPKPGVTQMLLDGEERVEKAQTILLDFPPSSTSVEASAVEACAVEAHAEASTHMQTVNAGGLVSLYQGLPGALLKEGPPSALYLGVYEAVKSRLLANPSFEMFPILVYLLSGAVGETIGSVVRAPAENIKARVQSGADSSTLAAFGSVFNSPEGRSNVIRAWSASLIRDVPFGAIQLAIFEGLKSFLIDSSTIDASGVDSLASEALLGAIGGFVGALVTTPPDVIALRILVQPTSEGEEPIGAVEMTKRIWAEGGFPAFLTGWKERTLYWAPAIGLFLSCYCSIRQLAEAQ